MCDMDRSLRSRESPVVLCRWLLEGPRTATTRVMFAAGSPMRPTAGGILLGVELDLVVTVSRTYLELMDAALPALHRTDDTVVLR
jgi:hypothetical protein